MSCSPFDLRDYFLKELRPEELGQMERHLKACSHCQQELERLRVTGAALATMVDEEIPRRISFVSDKVFEPSPFRRFWRDIWGSSARLGFASAAMLSAALVFFALERPGAPVSANPALARQVESAVQKAVAETEAREERKMVELLAAADQRHAQQRDADLRAIDDQLSVLQKSYNVMLLTSNDFVKGTK
jgi:anti-sigma factor RsiW